MYKFKRGLVAVETRLGWLIMGKVPGEKNQVVSALTVTSLLTHNTTVVQLWRLDKLGIRGPTETFSTQELELATLDNFKETVITAGDG